jgi:lipocalin
MAELPTNSTMGSFAGEWFSVARIPETVSAEENHEFDSRI